MAAAAGVSTQTVSRVLNSRPDVSPETRKRVQNVVESLGYQPSALARSLIQRRSFMLGVVTAGLKYIGPSRTLSGITAAAETSGYSLLLKELGNFNTNNILPIFQDLIARHVDGVIWAVPEVDDNQNWVNKVSQDIAMPIVYLTMEPRQRISVVSINNYLGGRTATAHLIEQEYQNIGHIAGPLDWWEARQRMAGWKDMLRESGREVLDHQWVEGNWLPASGAQAFRQLLKQYPEMDAVFVANDQMALSVMQAAWQQDLKIPQRLGVVGFDNIVESAFFYPPLTTIQQDQYNLGRMAVDEVIKMIESSWLDHETVEPMSIMLTPTLIERQSSQHSRR